MKKYSVILGFIVILGYTMIPTEDITINYLLTDDQPYIGGISRFQLFIKNNMENPITYARINVTVIVAEDKSLLTQWSEEIVYIAPHDIQWVEIWFLWEYSQYIFQIAVYADNVKPTELEFVIFIAPNVMTVTASNIVTVTETEHLTTTTENHYISHYIEVPEFTFPQFISEPMFWVGVLFAIEIYRGARWIYNKIEGEISKL